MPEESCSRAESCTMLRNILHPENWIQYDWNQVKQDHENQQTQPPAAQTDFRGQTRIRYAEDVAYEYCRALEREIGIQIFYLPEWTQKDSGLLTYADMEGFPKNREYFQYVLAELKKSRL